MSEPFQGVIPPVTTPFSADGRLLLDSLQKNVQTYLQNGLAGVLLLGSNGEAVHLSEEEKKEIVDRIEPIVPHDRVLLIGLSSSTLEGALRFLEQIGRYRARAVLVSVPSYFKNRMNASALRNFFGSLADQSPFPVLLYNVPQYSGIVLQPELLADLADHDNIAGMKESSGNLIYLQDVLHRTREKDFQVLLGSAQILGPSLVLGIEAAILAVACAFPELSLEVMRRYSRGQSIRQAQSLLCRVANALTAQCGVPGLKYAMDLAGRQGGACRLPLLPLEESERTEIERIFRELQESGVSV